MASILYDLLGYPLPNFETIDEYIDFFYPHIRYLGADLIEKEVYLDSPWREIKEEGEDIILYIFKSSFDPDFSTGIKEGADFLKSINGKISFGVWSFISKSNTLFIQYGGRYEMYDLVFLDSNFFIFKKHRNQHTPINGRKYYLLVKESHGGKGWKDLMEILYDPYRKNMTQRTLLAIFVFIVFSILVILYL